MIGYLAFIASFLLASQTYAAPAGVDPGAWSALSPLMTVGGGGALGALLVGINYAWMQRRKLMAIDRWSEVLLLAGQTTSVGVVLFYGMQRTDTPLTWQSVLAMVAVAFFTALNANAHAIGYKEDEDE